jgi:hypothetical protein
LDANRAGVEEGILTAMFGIPISGRYGESFRWAMRMDDK